MIQRSASSVQSFPVVYRPRISWYPAPKLTSESSMSLTRTTDPRVLAAGVVADASRIDVLEGSRRGFDRGHVQPALVGEGAAPHVGLVGPRRDVDDLGHEVGRLGELGQVL